MERKNLADLVEAIQAINPDSRESIDLFARAFFETIIAGLKKDNFVKIKGFGTFKLITVSSRESVDVNTGERIEIDGHSKISFTPDTNIKDIVNKPFAHLQSVVINEGTDVSQMGLADNEKVEEIHKGLEQMANPHTDNSNPQSAIKMDAAEVSPLVEVSIEEETEQPEITLEEEVTVPQETDKQSVAEKTDTDTETSETPEQTPKEEEEPTADEDEYDDSEDYVQPSKPRLWWIWIAVAAIVFFAIGYLAGHANILNLEFSRSNTPAATVKQKPQAATADKSVATEKNQNKAQNDSSIAQTANSPKKKEYKPIMEILPGDEYMIVGQKELHELKEGENITILAKQIYGSKECVKYIIRFNNISNPDVIPIGTKLKIPELVPAAEK